MRVSYQVEAGKVTYEGKKVAGADAASLRLFEERPECAVDAKVVYCYGRKAPLDAATFEVLGGRYLRDASTIAHLGEQRLSVLKDVDPDTFEFLRGIYARDSKRVYAHGLALKSADVDAFRALAENLAVDGRRMWRDKVPERLDLRGYDLDRLRGVPFNDGGWYPSDWFLECDGQVIVRRYRSEDRQTRLRVVEGADVASFAIMSRTYQRDANRLYCDFQPLRELRGTEKLRMVGDMALVVDDAVYRRDAIVKGADAASFDLAGDQGYRDKAWIYDLGGERRQPAPVVPGVTQALETLLPPLLARAFDLFDRHLLYHVDGDDPQQDPPPPADSPAFNWQYEDGRISLDFSGAQVSGDVSDVRGWLGRAWSLQRSGAGTAAGWRLETSPWYSYNGGNQLLRTLALMGLAPSLAALVAALEGEGETEQALLLSVPLLAQQFVPRRIEEDIAALVPPGVAAKVHEIVHGRLSLSRATYLSGGKTLVKRADWADPDPLVRVLALQQVYYLIASTGNIGGFLKHVIPALHARLTEEDVPAVRTQLLACLEAAVVHGFSDIESSCRQLHAALRPLVESLVEEGVNLPLNLLRLWECCEAAGDGAGAQASWSRAQGMVGEHDPLPPMWTGLHQIFGNAAFWRIGGWLRLAHVLPKRVDSQRSLDEALRELDALRETHGRHEALNGYAYSLVEVESACERLGVASPYATPEPEGVVMRSQRIEQAHAAPWEAQDELRLLRAGLFEEVSRPELQGYPWYRPLDAAASISADTTMLGIEAMLDGQPWARRLRCRLEVTSPDGQSRTFDDQPFDLGVRSGTYVALRAFGDPIVAGCYTLALSLATPAESVASTLTASLSVAIQPPA